MLGRHPDVKGQGFDSCADADTPQAGPRKCDEEFWYEDGTIILIVGDVEFRVFKGLLVDRSSVFRDMFAFPQPPSGASTSAGQTSCPEVALTDSPADVRHLLHFLMPGGKSAPPSPKDSTFDNIFACICLGHKYQIDYVVQQGLELLRAKIPAVDVVQTSLGNTTFRKPQMSRDNTIRVIKLARLLDANDLLFQGVWSAAYFTPQELSQGFLRPDGTHEVLSTSDLALCFSAKERLIQEHCEPRGPSGKTCYGKLAKALQLTESEIDAWPILEHFTCWKLQDDQKFGICNDCLALLRKRETDGRMDVWKRLPEIIGVEYPNWNQTAVA
ncbi:hypothetical protein DICSQDRAFT_171228 [Dichomitus squalens LYAD-421 SS1]|uniref:BTB domain-containing protein n=1 Tax=Dichomitus squalens (strain LYAD-421) TaxID=732165 RepID=R7SWF0_DICSQ|nr:uncharacterized protein DICSQDRAFT_171228 [Dichomitus squalens LYAD-421 SS1]EJF60258.1 hypothetical protein DICSQDRAFT_171228 [Dichomitus squalens LYAD-421 SS1]